MKDRSPHHPFSGAFLTLLFATTPLAHTSEVSLSQQRADGLLPMFNASYQLTLRSE
jgi:hypothetical protein